ncbi:MAG: hypothetical protein AAF675_20005 [Pseudomonadota bacterium]
MSCVLLGAVALGSAADVPAVADGDLRYFERPASMTRDRDFNRVMRRSPVARVTSATAQGNLVAVTQEGRGNTIVLQVEQSNSGAVSANAALNGSLSLD